jgi:hypothetical protein
VAVAPGRGAILQAVFWGEDAGKRTFDIIVNHKTIATQTLQRNAPGKFFEVQWPLPQELIGGKNKVAVRFQAHPGHTAGGLFGLATLKLRAEQTTSGVQRP